MAKAAVKKDEVPEENSGIEFTFKGVKLVLPQGDDIPRKAIRAMEQNHLVTFLEEMLGEAQMRKIDNKLVTLRDIKDLNDAVAEAQDSTVGE